MCGPAGQRRPIRVYEPPRLRAARAALRQADQLWRAWLQRAAADPGSGRRRMRQPTKFMPAQRQDTEVAVPQRIYVPSTGPNDWRRLLADPAKQWRKGYSAMAVARCW